MIVCKQIFDGEQSGEARNAFADFLIPPAETVAGTRVGLTRTPQCLLDVAGFNSLQPCTETLGATCFNPY